MPGINIHHHANDVPDPIQRPLAATQTYKSGDPVSFVGDALTVSPTDNTPVLIAELAGFAAQGALGEQATSRTGLTFGGGFGGAATGAARSFYPATPSLLLRTKNFWAAGAAGTQQAKTGAIRGLLRQLSATNVADDVAQWGVENTAATIATDATCHIVDVLDNDMQPVAVGATLTAGEGWLVFRIVGTNQWTGTTTSIVAS